MEQIPVYTFESMTLLKCTVLNRGFQHSCLCNHQFGRVPGIYYNQTHHLQSATAVRLCALHATYSITGLARPRVQTSLVLLFILMYCTAVLQQIQLAYAAIQYWTTQWTRALLGLILLTLRLYIKREIYLDYRSARVQSTVHIQSTYSAVTQDTHTGHCIYSTCVKKKNPYKIYNISSPNC